MIEIDDFRQIIGPIAADRLRAVKRLARRTFAHGKARRHGSKQIATVKAGG
jgi:hypothetical protein